MKHLLFFSFTACAIATQAAQPVDSIPMQTLEEVTVVATRAGDKTPIAFSNINKQMLQAVNHGKDMPAILNMMPGVTTSSDAGTGIGYTGIHVRGHPQALAIVNTVRERVGAAPAGRWSRITQCRPATSHAGTPWPGSRPRHSSCDGTCRVTR